MLISSLSKQIKTTKYAGVDYSRLKVEISDQVWKRNTSTDIIWKKDIETIKLAFDEKNLRRPTVDDADHLWAT